MTDVLTARLGRLALIFAALLVLGIVVMRTGRDATPPPQSQAPAPGDVAAMTAELEAKLKANPNDADGWRMLGWTRFQTGQYGAAAVAYRRAAALKPGDGELQSSLGEALFAAGPGTSFPAEARAAFEAAAKQNPNDARARYFLGIAQDMAGDHRGAIDGWIALLKETPPGAPWETDLRRTIAAVGAKNGIDVANRLAAIRPAAPAGAGQSAMIEGMVASLAAKLKADPKNADGWIMLMRSYMTLGRKGDAESAYRTAVTANPDAKAQLDEAAKTLGIG